MSNFSFRNRSVDSSHFAIAPGSKVPRSLMKTPFAHKTTFDAGYLVPVLVQEVVPGDSFNVRMTAFTRMATPITPLMDNLYLDSFFFFVPNRLVWDNFEKFIGARIPNPSSSIDYLVPVVGPFTGGYNPCTLQDYMGLPQASAAQVGNWSYNSLPLRAYNLIYNEWFRDQNLQNSAPVPTDDGPDTSMSNAGYILRRRCKRHDYFTSALPFAQKGTAASLPLTGNAPVLGIGVYPQGPQASGAQTFYETATGATSYAYYTTDNFLTAPYDPTGASIGVEQNAAGEPQVYADLSSVTAVTVNALREAVTVQQLLERDARGGTRYIEIIRSHFGVLSPDARLQRPEYLGGGSSPININPVAQTSETADTPQGNLSGVGTGVAHHGFSKSFVEHGYVIGLVNVRADLTYQQGLNKMWSRRTRYDFYWPAFANLGEQAVLRKEIYSTGGANDAIVFGYQERWAEMRYKPSQISGLFNSVASPNIDEWHLAQFFSAAPTLSSTFIEENPPIARVIAAGDLAAGQQFLFDSFFDMRMVRPIPQYSVPGLTRF